jgi:integrase/recombinase XerD
MQMLNSVLTGDVLGDKRARLLLRQRKHPYYLGLMMGRSLGYCRKVAGNGKWVARVRTIKDRYLEKTLGYADDYAVADNQKVFSFAQAQESARAWFQDASHLLLRTEARKFGQTEELSVCPIGSEFTVAHAIKDFIDWRRDFGARQSFISAISLANTYILPTVGSIPCSELTASQLRSVLLAVEGTARKRGGFQSRELIDPRTLTPDARRRRRRTANNTFSLLRSSLKKAFREGKISSDDSWRFVQGFPHIDLARTTSFSWLEAKRLLDSADPALRRIMLGGLYTGCRVTELFRITPKDIQASRMSVYIHPLKNYRGRTIALPEEGYHFFRSLAVGVADGTPLFSRNDGKPWNSQYLAKKFRQLCRKLGHSDNYVFHSLRHTYASLLLQAGTSPIVVSRQLGHVTMATVIKTYAHVADDFIDHELRKRFKPGFSNPPDLFSNHMAGHKDE